MAILSTDLIFQLTGGAANTNPLLSLGGVNSGNTFGTALHALFDATSAAEALAGDIEYRAIDIKNNHGTESLLNPVLWISTDATGASDIVAISLDAGTQSVANESTAPSAPALTFTTPTSKATGLAVADMVAGATQRVWLRWSVTAGASALLTSITLTLEGDTGP